MKKILILIFFLASLQSFGQGIRTKPVYITAFIDGEFKTLQVINMPIAGYTKINARYQWTAGYFDTALHVPQYNGVPSGLRSGSATASGAIAVDTSNHRLYFYSGGSWRYSTASTSGGSVPISSLTAATQPNDINNGAFGQIWRFNAISSGNGLAIESNSTAAASNTQTLLAIGLNGANSAASQTTYALNVQNYHTGSGDNIAAQFQAKFGTNNYAIIVPSGGGNVGIGTSTPDSSLHVKLGAHFERGIKAENLPNFADTTNFKPLVINTTGTAGTIGTLYKATYWPGGGGGGTSWLLSGNSIASGDAEFFGSTNNRTVIVKTNNTKIAAWDSTGSLEIGTYGHQSILSTNDAKLIVQGTFGQYESGVLKTYIGQVSSNTKLVLRDASSNDDIVLNTGGNSYINGSGNFGVSQTSPTTKLQVAGTFASEQGADVASANNLAVISNSVEITGTTQINLIANTGWVNGSVIHLIFTSTPTVKNGQTTSGSNITILLAGAADFSATADDVLTLMLCEVGGTQAWREVSRSVN